MRGLLTISAVLAYAAIVAGYAPWATLQSASMAGAQLQNSDGSAVQSQLDMSGLAIANLVATLAFAGCLVLIWRGPVWRAVGLARKGLLPAAVAFGVIAVAQPQPAAAFFETTDKTEAYTILPNESAFWIPDTGANKDSQNKLDSEDYLNSNKVPLKRFVVPHQKLQGSGGICILCVPGWDAFVPAGRLIIVDRTPYSREWVDAADRGSAAKKEGFPCQSKEGLNITAGISVGVSVSETNAAKFLYHFGVVAANGNRADPQVIFTTVYYGRSLIQVMDDVGRKKVQTLVCAEIGARSFDAVNAEMPKMMDAIQKQAADYFATVGITLDFIGWGDTLAFDHDVQAAVNRRYIATQDQAIAIALAPYADTIQKLAAAQALRSFGEKSDGKLPTTIVGLPGNVGDMLKALLAQTSQPVARP